MFSMWKVKSAIIVKSHRCWYDELRMSAASAPCVPCLPVLVFTACERLAKTLAYGAIEFLPPQLPTILPCNTVRGILVQSDIASNLSQTIHDASFRSTA